MMNRIKTTAVVFLSIIALLVTFNVTSAMKAVPKRQDKTHAHSGNSSRATASKSEYQVLLTKYLANADSFEKQHRESAQHSWNVRVASLNQSASTDLDASKTLEQLRAASLHRPGKKLTFDGDVEENAVFVPSSDVSAKVFRQLYDEKLCDSSDIVRKLSHFPKQVSKEWIPLLQDIADHSQPDTSVWRSSRWVLYTMGISRKQYRSDIEKFLSDFPSPSFLQALLFETDKDTGEANPVQCQENSVLVKRILDDPTSSPELLEVCAEYAADTGNMAQAEGICVDLLSRQYIASDKEEKGANHPDGQLCRARTFAMHLMFYIIKTPQCFKAIYDLSRANVIDPVPPEKRGSNWRALWTRPEGQMDISLAQSFIEKISECK